MSKTDTSGTIATLWPCGTGSRDRAPECPVRFGQGSRGLWTDTSGMTVSATTSLRSLGCGYPCARMLQFNWKRQSNYGASSVQLRVRRKTPEEWCLSDLNRSCRSEEASCEHQSIPQLAFSRVRFFDPSSVDLPLFFFFFRSTIRAVNKAVVVQHSWCKGDNLRF